MIKQIVDVLVILMAQICVIGSIKLLKKLFEILNKEEKE